ncbi:hypothetical protein LSH36_24g05012 [Paralvinella palmiformis]|uniref:L-Fucosyltransferase n=1 Tax=Paralvinella palmiformis TaxID=53620 RepID=A0AAD9K9W8_9ANNE|nr:hypothetical protein LSH36_24g05012 [Paralvinella palmiformis]
MSRRGGPPAVLRRTFVFLVLLTVLMVCLLETFHNDRLAQRPKYGLQRTYVAAECADRRLGNAMFIYAAVVGVAGRLNASTMMERSCRVVDVFTLSALVVSDLRLSLPMYAVYEEFGRRASAYDINIKKLRGGNTLLRGYFQSWRYFDEAFAEVRKEFVFAEGTSEAAAEFLGKSLPEGWKGRSFVRVGVHIRRGDLLKEYYKNYGYATADKEYFDRAMDYFKRRYSSVQFVVCSDDIRWAKENVLGDHVVYSEDHRDYEDMAILSRCNHTIISVGSFGWWAAWLANGTTIYYDNWPKEYSKLEYHVNKKTYFPPDWIPMR